MTVSLEKIFFSFVLKNKRYFDIVEPHFFKNMELLFVYNIIKKYISTRKEADVPSPKQILEMVQLEDRDGLITKDILKAMLSVTLSEYDEDNFIIPKFNAWVLANRLKSGTVDIIDETRNLETKSDFDSVLDSANKIRTIVEQMSNVNFADDDDMGSDFDDPEMHVQDSSRFKIRSGFDTIDHMLGGGWDISTLNIIMASTNAGKCTFFDTYISIRIKNNSNTKVEKIGSVFTKISNRDNDISNI
jgi:replicative DNA helicase